MFKNEELSEAEIITTDKRERSSLYSPDASSQKNILGHCVKSVKSLRKRTLHSSIFEFSGYGTQQILRLVSNIILSRLLFPAAFGLASTISILTTGLTMLSDMGIQQFLIQNPQSDESNVLNTAFTFQAIRGLILALVMIALSRPASLFFKEPKIVTLVWIGSIQLIAQGLRSTSIHTLRKRLTLGWITVLELGKSILTLSIMIPWAIASPSVLPLVASGTISTCVYSVATHFLPVGYRNSFHWDKSAFKKMRDFGRWIFGSSMVTFFGAQTDRILYGRFLGMTWLGVYSIALNLSSAISALLYRLISGIVYPLLSHANRDPERDISTVYYRVRLRIDVLAMGGTGFLAGVGGWIITSLWDDRYADASWILGILCLKVALSSFLMLGETCLTSQGHSRFGFFSSLCRFIFTIAGMPIGWFLGGVVGTLWAIAFAEVPAIFIIWPQLHKMKILRIKRELLSIVLFLTAYAAGSFILRWLPEIHVRR